MKFEVLISKDLGSGTPNIYLDTFQEESISLNFNIADITDISSKNSSYSKTISLPDTSRNRRAFDDIFNIEAVSPDWDGDRVFNPNKKVACIVLGDSLEIFTGNLQLTNIVYDFNGNRHSYEVVIYSDNDTLFKILGEQYLTDLDLSRFDHNYVRTNMEQSWDSEFTNGYFYPLIDYGFPLSSPRKTFSPLGGWIVQNPFEFNQFYTAVYTKIIFDQIFTQAGFSYESDFLNGERFTNLIIPFSNKNFVPSPTLTTDINDNIFYATKTATYSITGVAAGYDTRYTGSLQVDTTVFDPNNLYNDVDHYYQNLSTESYKQKFTINFKLRTTNFKQNTFWVDDSDDIRIWCKRSKSSNGTTNPAWSDTPTYNQLYDPSDPNYFRDVFFNGGQGISVRNVIAPAGGLSVTQLANAPGGFSNWLLEGTCTTDWLESDPLQPNEQVRFFVTRFHYIPLLGPSVVTFEVAIGTNVYGTLDRKTAVYNSNISIKNVLPTKVKQKDFLTSIFKMFNLYIEPLNNESRRFIIEPRDEYYSKHQVQKNWSDKIDLSQGINSEILSNLQKRTNTFIYKEDKDFYNTNYKTNTNEVFGQFRFELDNDFISDENKIEPIFSPTPLDRLPGSANIYLPIIYNNNNGNYSKPDGMNIRILYRKMVRLTGFDTFAFSTNFNYDYYPYAGFADDPTAPLFTLNFGSISPYYTGYTETLNNLFNTYYRNQISELNDEGSRLITANFNINSYDINNFKFSDLIFFTVNGMSSWYRVVKIMDYDPVIEKTTKIQLIKAYNYSLGASASEDGNGTCIIQLVMTLDAVEAESFMNIVNLNFDSLQPFLTFYNQYDGIPYSYDTQADSLHTIQDIIDFCNNNIPGMSVTRGANFEVIWTWNLEVTCGTTGIFMYSCMMSSSVTTECAISLWTSPEGFCFCETSRVNPYQENGLRNLLATDNVYVGVINTSTSNRTLMPNVAMVGSNNSVAYSGVLTVGDGNSSYGQNSVLVGQSNQTTTGQTLIVGDTNIVNGANSMAIGSGNLVSTPQSLVLGVNNQIQSQNPSQSGTQSLLMIGNNNTSLNTSGFVYGNDNLIGTSVSNPFIFGNNNNLNFNGPSNSSLDSIFVIGNNITITQSVSNTLYIETENIVSNVTGTSSFNKMVIGDLVLQDLANNSYGRFQLNQYNPTDYPGGSYLVFNSPIPGMEIVYQDLDGGYLHITRNDLIDGSSQIIKLQDDEIRTIINTTSSTVTESILLANSQIFKVNNQISHKILGEELDLSNITKYIYLSDFYYDYMDFFTSSTLDIDIMVRYNSGIEVGFDYLSQRSWYNGGGMSVFTATGSRVSYNNLTSPNDVQSYIDQYSSIIWGGDEPALVLYANFGFTASFYYEINLKYNSI